MVADIPEKAAPVMRMTNSCRAWLEYLMSRGSGVLRRRGSGLRVVGDREAVAALNRLGQQSHDDGEQQHEGEVGRVGRHDP